MRDLISRQEAIDEATKDGAYGYISAEELVRLPSSDRKKGKWIPCSERLPEEFYVLCCDDRGEMLIANPFECENSDTGYSAESDDCYMYNCIAWMPLPEPYKAEEVEQ